MQLQLDWAQRDRCAHIMDKALKDIGVGLAQRAIAVMVFSHPAAELVDRDRQVWILKISYRRAADWIAHKSDLYRNLRLHHSALHQAMRAWCERGVMICPDRQQTVLIISATLLRDWHDQVFFDPEEFARQWTHQKVPVDRCSVAFSAVQSRSGPSHHSERVSEGDSFNQERNTHSLTHSAGAPSAALPDLPIEVWDPQVTEKRLYAVMGAWWVSEGLADRGHDPDDVLGAVLAARRNKATSPQSYVERCLAGGVRSGWKQQAAAMRRRFRTTSAPAAVTESRAKPARVIGPGATREVPPQ